MHALWNPDLYLKAWNFAARAHGEQKVPGSDMPYITHVGAVAMEVMTAIVQTPDVEHPDLAVQCALLHDVVEDTDVSVEQLADAFGPAVAEGVLALSKDPRLPDRQARLLDSLRRIRAQPHEIWMVKLADRITNLQPPPAHWSQARIKRYLAEAAVIYEQLHDASDWLAERLARKMDQYRQYAG